MDQNELSDDEVIARFFRALRVHVENDEVMKAWGSAGRDGQIPDDAADIISRFERKKIVENPVEGRMLGPAGLYARFIAEKRFTSIDDPELEKLARARMNNLRRAL